MNTKLVPTLLLILILPTILSAQQFTVDWTYSAKAAITGVDVFDINQDGISEILATSTDGHVYAIDSQGRYLWRKYNHCQAHSLKADDLENDGKFEILVGGCRHLDLLKSGGQEVWSHSVGHEIKKILTQDLDGNKVKEIIISAESISGRESLIRVLDIEGKTLWEKNYKGAKIGDIYVGDINHDSTHEILVGTKKLMAYSPNGELVKTYDFDSQISHISVTDKRNVIVGTYKKLTILDDKWEVENEFETKSQVWDTQINDIYIYVGTDELKKFSLETQREQWFMNTGEDVTQLIILDLDSNGEEEIVSASKNIQITDLNGNQLWNHTPYRSITSMQIKDIDEDGFIDVIAGSADHNIYFIKHTTKHKNKVIGDKLYQNAIKKASQGDANGSIKLLDQALNLNPGEITYLDYKKQVIRQDLKRLQLEDAKQKLFSAHSFNKMNDLEQAKEIAQDALSDFTKLDDQENVKNTLELIRQIDEKLSGKKTITKKEVRETQYLWIVPLILLFILIGVFIYFLIIKKPKIPEQI